MKQFIINLEVMSIDVRTLETKLRQETIVVLAMDETSALEVARKEFNKKQGLLRECLDTADVPQLVM